MRRHTADMRQPAVILCFNAPRYMAGDPRFR